MAVTSSIPSIYGETGRGIVEAIFKIGKIVSNVPQDAEPPEGMDSIQKLYEAHNPTAGQDFFPNWEVAPNREECSWTAVKNGLSFHIRLMLSSEDSPRLSPEGSRRRSSGQLVIAVAEQVKEGRHFQFDLSYYPAKNTFHPQGSTVWRRRWEYDPLPDPTNRRVKRALLFIDRILGLFPDVNGITIVDKMRTQRALEMDYLLILAAGGGKKPMRRKKGKVN
jgi:hypothetical protein